MFDSMDEILPRMLNLLQFQTWCLNPSTEQALSPMYPMIQDGFNLDEHRGAIIILDFMAHDCSNCHAVQEHIEDKMDEWHSQRQRPLEKASRFSAMVRGTMNRSSTSMKLGGYTSQPTLPVGGETLPYWKRITTRPSAPLYHGGQGQIPVVMVH